MIDDAGGFATLSYLLLYLPMTFIYTGCKVLCTILKSIRIRINHPGAVIIVPIDRDSRN